MKSIFSFLVLFVPLLALSQSVEGEFGKLANQSIKLIGFNNFETYVIDSALTDTEGKFKLNYKTKDYGMAQLKSIADQSLIIVLEDDSPILAGADMQNIEELEVSKGKENQMLYTYMKEQPQREQAISAWSFLQKKYQESNVFQSHSSALQTIKSENQLLQEEGEKYIADLPQDSYMKWYLPLRNLLGNVGNVARNKPELIPTTLKQLRSIDLTDEKLNKSGMFYDALFNHVWLIENSSGPLEQVFKDLNTSIDSIAAQLKANDDRFNLVMEKLFEILEERSLFTSSEYLAEKLLKGDDCGCLNPQLQKKLERYGRLAQGQIAPDITFSDFTYYPQGVSAKSLKAVDADYKLVVFAAGWCPHCVEAMPKIVENYKDWKSKGVEVIFVSLDENPRDFGKFAGPLPFISTTDYKKWDGKAVEDYQVYATPSYFILDKDLKILIRPKSVEHIKSWLDAYAK